MTSPDAESIRNLVIIDAGRFTEINIVFNHQGHVGSQQNPGLKYKATSGMQSLICLAEGRVEHIMLTRA